MTLRPIKIDGDVAYITLTRGYTAVIDAADVALVGDCSWQTIIKPNTAYTAYAIGRWRAKSCNVVGVMSYLHRVILDAPVGFHTDHINGNGLDNRRENLRLATPSQNCCNRVIGRNNTSGYKGVCFDKKSEMWRAQIMIDRKTSCLGSYDTPEAAHAAYCEASERLHGEFGRVE